MDEPIDKEIWEAYYLYLECLDDFCKRVSKVESNKEVQYNRGRSFSFIAGFVYKLIFMKSLAIPNRLYWDFRGNFLKAMYRDDKKALRTLWDQMLVPPVAPFGGFFNPTVKECIWRKYQINEKSRRSEFLNMETLKLSNAMVMQHIDVLRLL